MMCLTNKEKLDLIAQNELFLIGILPHFPKQEITNSCKSLYTLES